MTFRIGVAGVGVMGEHHCRTLCSLKKVSEVYLFDLDQQRVHQVGQRYPVTIAKTYAELLDLSDGVVIATPANTHALLVQQAIQKRRHVFVEKPFVPSVQEARQVLQLLQAIAQPLVVKVGFIEQYNPAIQQLQAMVDIPKIEAFFAQRLGAPPRKIEADVVMDVMIHDLDILLQLQRGPITSIDAVGHRVNDIIEEAFVLIAFAEGCRASLWASRRSAYKVRQLQINEGNRTFLIDYAKRTLKLFHCPQHFSRTYTLDNVEEKVGLSYGDPLFNELNQFMEAMDQPTASWAEVEDTIRVIQLVEEIRNKIS